MKSTETIGSLPRQLLPGLNARLESDAKVAGLLMDAQESVSPYPPWRAAVRPSPAQSDRIPPNG
jgi:hypothetical protein